MDVRNAKEGMKYSEVRKGFQYVEDLKNEMRYTPVDQEFDIDVQEKIHTARLYLARIKRNHGGWIEEKAFEVLSNIGDSDLTEDPKLYKSAKRALGAFYTKGLDGLVILECLHKGSNANASPIDEDFQLESLIAGHYFNYLQAIKIGLENGLDWKKAFGLARYTYRLSLTEIYELFDGQRILDDELPEYSSLVSYFNGNSSRRFDHIVLKDFEAMNPACAEELFALYKRVLEIVVDEYSDKIGRANRYSIAYSFVKRVGLQGGRSIREYLDEVVSKAKSLSKNSFGTNRRIFLEIVATEEDPDAALERRHGYIRGLYDAYPNVDKALINSYCSPRMIDSGVIKEFRKYILRRRKEIITDWGDFTLYINLPNFLEMAVEEGHITDRDADVLVAFMDLEGIPGQGTIDRLTMAVANLAHLFDEQVEK